MSNSFLQLLAETERKRWCVTMFCGCYLTEYRSAIALINDLQSALETVDLSELTSYDQWRAREIEGLYEPPVPPLPLWCCALRITSILRGITLDWGPIFSAWLPYARQHVWFLDLVFFYLVARVPCDPEVYNSWLTTCVDVARQTRNTSLLETLVRVLRADIRKYGDLLEYAVAQAGDPMLRNALAVAGFLPWDVVFHRERKRTIAGHRLFGAIRQDDVEAVRTLVAKGATQTVTDEQGRTPLAYARALQREELVPILESAYARQAAARNPD